MDCVEVARDGLKKLSVAPLQEYFQKVPLTTILFDSKRRNGFSYYTLSNIFYLTWGNAFRNVYIYLNNPN